MNLNNILKRTYDATMKREGIKVASYFGSEQFDAFFRMNNDGMNQQETLIMFYGLDAPVQNGTIVLIRGEKYIALNKETIECDVYYKSTMIKANGAITNEDYSVCGLPFFSTDMNYGNAKTNGTISIIDGRMEVLTEDCELAHNLKINDYFNEWGRTWQIENIYFVDGICKIVLQVTADKVIEHKYTLELAEIGTLNANMGDMMNLYATAYCDGIEVPDAELKWHTSNPEIATIDDDGTALFKWIGNVSFSVSWDEHALIKYTNDIKVVVGTPAAEEGLLLFVEEAKELYCDDDNEPLEYYVTKDGTKVDIPVYFRAEYPANPVLEKKISIVAANGKVTVNPADSRLRGKTFTLVAYNEDKDLEERQEIKCISAW